MDYEVVLLSVAIGAGYWGWFFLRRRPFGTGTFGAMCLMSALLAVLGIAGRHVGSPLLGVLGAIGLGGGVCLLGVGPLLRWLARLLAGKERYGIAQRLLDVSDLLAPGSGAADEKAMFRAMREIRDGRIEGTVDALVAAKHAAPEPARRAIDERIAMLYLAAYRWTDAIAHAETHLLGAMPEEATGEPAAGIPLRRALGIAPPVWVELLGAYGRTGDLDRAAEMLARLEDVAAGRDDAGVWLHRARLMFLALAGRPDAVRGLIARGRARHMTAAARTYWLAVALENHGNAGEANAAYAKARGRSRGKPREMIDEALARLAHGSPAKPHVELGDVASQVVARVEAAPFPAIATRAIDRGPWVTNALTIAVVTVSALIAACIGPSNDLGVLLRSGAIVHSFVASGEWWRLVSCVFIHIGLAHLLLNVLGLWVLGRIAEDMFGGARMLAIFGVAGVAGACASFFLTPNASAGASGAVFGLLGAVFVEMTWHRERYRQAYTRGMWGGLVIVTIAQIAYGFAYAMVDQWAHGAGLASGALLGFVLSPHARWTRPARRLGQLVAVAFTAACIVTAVMVSVTSVSDSFARQPHEIRMINGVTVDAPTPWRITHTTLVEPELFVSFDFDAPVGAIGPILIDQMSKVPNQVRALGFDTVEKADNAVTLPPGWEHEELVVSQPNELGDRVDYRVVIAGKHVDSDTASDGKTLLATIYLPASLVELAPRLVEHILAPAISETGAPTR